MRKSFLLVFLLGLLPLAMWAAPTTPKTNATLAGTLTYNKAAQPLLTKALVLPDDYDTSVGEVFYLALTTDGTPTPESPKWSKDFPTGEDADTYRVWYKITSDGTYTYEQNIQKIGNVTINKKDAVAGTDFTAPTGVADLVFDNTSQTVVSATKPDHGHFVYQYRQQTNWHSGWGGYWDWSGWSTGWSETLPAGTNARQYEIRYRYINEDGNYNDWGTSKYTTITANIARATWGEGAAIYTAPKQKEDAIFDNTNQNYLTPGTAAFGATMQYSNSASNYATWYDNVNNNTFRATNVAENPYTRYYRIQGGNGYNWNALAATAVTANILPRDAKDITGGVLAGPTLEYTGADQQLITTAYALDAPDLLGSGSATIHYYVNGTDAGTDITGVTGKEFGDYEISYSIVFTGNALRNYNPVPASDKTKLGTVTIDKKILTIAGVGYTKDYDEIPLEATPENAVLFVDGIGWLAADEADDAKKASILAKLLTVKSGLPEVNVGKYSVEIESKEDPSLSYKIDPLFHATPDLNILKVDNSWVKKVTITPSWEYGTTPATPDCEATFKTKETGDPAEITFKYYTDEACTTEYTDPIDDTMPAGEYWVKAFVEGCNNFFELETADADAAKFTIEPSAPEWTEKLDIAGWEYGSTPNEPTAKVEDDAEITFKYFDKDDNEIAKPTSTLAVGEYYVKAYAEATANHTALVSAAKWFEVTPTVLPATGIEDVESVYNGTNQNPGADAINALVLANTGLVAGTDYELSFDPADGDFTHVGEYYVIATGKGNYAKLDGEGNVNVQKVKFTITPAEVNADEIIAGAAFNMTYDNTDQVLTKEAAIADGSILEGSFMYKLSTDDDTKWGANVPTGKNAGTYTVQTKFIPTGDFKPYEEIAEVEATIQLAQLKITLTNTLEKDWDGIEFGADQVEETYVIDGLQGDDAYVIPFTLSLPVTAENNFIDAKVYELKSLDIAWKDEDVKNYKIAFVTVGSVTINKADLVVGVDFDAPLAVDPAPIYDGKTEWALVFEGEMFNDYGKILYYQGEKAPAEDSEDWTEKVPTAIEAGDYPVWYMVKADDNHNNFVASAALAGKIATASLEDVDIAMSEDATYNKTNQAPEYTLTYKVDDKTTLTLVEGKDKDFEVVKITNKAGEDVTEFINADTYTFTFAAVEGGNYSGTTSATYTINPFGVIAEALPTSKVYNGLVGKELRADETYANGKTEIVVKYGGLFTGDEDAITADGAISIEKASRNVGDYEIVLDKDAFVSQNYIITDVTGAMFQITPAALTINWNDADPGFSKVYGEDDPALTATIDNLVIEGAGDGDEDDIIANTVITRAEGEEVGKYGITLSAYKDAKGNIAPVFKNYTFDTPFDTADEAFAITEAGIKVSIAPQVVTFTGKKAVIEVTADKLVITGLENEDDKAKVFEGGSLPEITIPDDAVNVGEYKVTLAKGKSLNYTIEYLPSYITVEPVLVKGVFTTIPVAAVGVEGQEILDNTVWSVEAADAADAATVENYSDQFELNIDESILDKDGKIKTEDGEDALFIVYTGSPENFVMDPETDSADLNIGGKDTEIALDDSAPVVTYKSETGTTVTFTQSRAVAEDKWQACVLPCTVSIEDFSNAFGYAAVDLFDMSRTNADEIHFSLQVTGNIEAGVPFLFKANKDNNFNEIEIENATMANTADLNTVVEDDDTDIKFIGTFEGVNLTTAGYRYISKGSWYATKDGQSKPYVIKPLRAYLDLGTMFTGARIFIEEPDGTVTAIDTITLEGNNAEGLYNLNGMKVNQGLKGVYIQNGKKVIKK